MKFLQSALCGLLLTASAVAQTPATSPSAPSHPSQSSGSTAAASPRISSLGGDEVKGPEHPITLEQMKVLYVAMGYEKTINQNLQTMIAMQKTRAPFVPVAFWDDLDSSFQKIDYPTALLDVYKKYLSTEDAAKLIDFSKTEAGKHFLETLPVTSREANMAIQKEQQQTGMQVQARHKDEIEAAMKKYREEHQPKPAPTLGAPNPPSGSSTPAKPATSTPPSSTSTPPPSNPQN